MHGHRNLQLQATDRPIPAHTASKCILRRTNCFDEGVTCQQPRS
ncbi:hypothetical protein PENNAL_c0833G03855, partial [Penicillium nalgiovense]